MEFSMWSSEIVCIGTCTGITAWTELFLDIDANLKCIQPADGAGSEATTDCHGNEAQEEVSLETSTWWNYWNACMTNWPFNQVTQSLNLK